LWRGSACESLRGIYGAGFFTLSFSEGQPAGSSVWWETKAHRLKWLRKNSQLVIPKGGLCPRNLLFLGSREEMQIPRFARDDKKYFFRSLFNLRVLVFVRTNPRRLLFRKAQGKKACATGAAGSGVAKR